MELDSITIVGPTACGKTRRAVDLANAFDGEIISGDSRQIYRGMTIGTGKDLCEYGNIPFHLIDICDAGEKYNLHRYLKDFNKAYSDIIGRGKLPVICGGTGMYIENALNGIIMPDVPENPDLRRSLEKKSLSELTEILAEMKKLHNDTDVDTPKRAIRAIEIQQYYLDHPYEAENVSKNRNRRLNSLVVGIEIPREERRIRITKRLHARMEEGMIDEIRNLIRQGVSPESLIYYGLEYKFVTQYVIGEISFDRMLKDLETAIHQFAKRQMTWFRGMEKRGIRINWIPFDLPKDAFISRVSELIE